MPFNSKVPVVASLLVFIARPAFSSVEFVHVLEPASGSVPSTHDIAGTHPCAGIATVPMGLSNGNLGELGYAVLLSSTHTGLVVGATIELAMMAPPGADASNFAIGFYSPVFANGRYGASYGITGEGLGWSGEGEFEVVIETDAFNGYLEVDPRLGLNFWETLVQPIEPPFNGQVFTKAVVKLALLPGIPGDIDGNLVVDDADLGLLLGSFATTSDGDVNCDDVTNDADLGLMLDYFGECFPSVCVVEK